ARFKLARYLKTYEFLVKPFRADNIHRVLSIHQRVSLPTRVVIVDDSATVRKMVKKILAGSIFNIHVADAASGDEALAMCANGVVRLVLPGLKHAGPQRTRYAVGASQEQSGRRDHHDVGRAQRGDGRAGEGARRDGVHPQAVLSARRRPRPARGLRPRAADAD